MAITVVGSVAFDSIETPAGRRERCLGGAATYFSLAASYFTSVRVIAVVGEDFGPEQQSVFDSHGIDTEGIERAAGKSFFWEGSYLENLNEAKTHTTELNVFGAFQPKIPESYRDSEFLFLANIDPVLQRRIREASHRAKILAGDTMNYWIKDHRDALKQVLKGLDILLINDTETRMLAGNNNLVQAARGVLDMGPRMLVVKHGEYGATAFYGRSDNGFGAKTFRAPALPLEEVVDPTGAGDSFAGAFLRAMFYGSVMGSFAVEKFGTERLQQLSRKEIDERFGMFRELTHLD